MDDANILIIGSAGQLGTALRKNYPDAQAVDSNSLDITDKDALMKYDWSKIKIIINAAAYTNVDGAESNEGRVTAWKVNATAVGNLVEVAARHDLTLVHISSEYVFDGSQNPHLETEPLSPLGVYAQSKAAGDVVVGVLPKHYIVRTSWVIGEGKNFVRTMLGLGAKGISPTVIADDIGRPTFTSELVRAIDHLLQTGADFGTYNVSNSGDPVSWADLTRAVFQAADLSLTVTDTTDEAYYSDKPDCAPRPRNSVFDLSKILATGLTLRDWREDLRTYIDSQEAQ